MIRFLVFSKLESDGVSTFNAFFDVFVVEAIRPLASKRSEFVYFVEHVIKLAHHVNRFWSEHLFPIRISIGEDLFTNLPVNDLIFATNTPKDANALHQAWSSGH